jgi:membrane protease YdiL (CAAX protease family)
MKLPVFSHRSIRGIKLFKLVMVRSKASLVETISELLAFARQPRFHESSYRRWSQRTVTGLWLFLISLAVTAGFALVTLPLMLLTEAGPSSTLRETSSQPILAVMIAVVMVGPLVEEVIFRGWLTGTWRSLVGSAMFLAIFYGGAALMKDLDIGAPGVKQLGIAILGLAAMWLLGPIDSGPRVMGYARAFPFLFWAQGIVFGLLHYQNFAATSPALAVLMTLPLIVCAWLWGYARIVLGLGGAVLLHAAYNVPAVIGIIAFTTMQGG